MSISGDSRLAWHVGNAILREDSRGARLAKETKDSPRRIDAAVAAVMAVHRAAELAGAPRLDIYIEERRSGGQLRAELLDVNDVVWLQDGLAGVKADLQHAGEPKGHLAHDAQDDRAVRLHPDLVDPDVPDPDLVVPRGEHNFEVQRCQLLQDPSVGKGEDGDPAGAGDGDLNPALLAQALIDERVINLDDFLLWRLGRRGGGAEHHHQQRSQDSQQPSGAASPHRPSPLA